MHIFPILKTKEKKKILYQMNLYKKNQTSISIDLFFTFMYFITWPTDQRIKYLIMDTPR